MIGWGKGSHWDKVFGFFERGNEWTFKEILKVYQFISVSKKEAVLIFQNVDEEKTKELIEILPYYPYMEKIEYHNLNKQF